MQTSRRTGPGGAGSNPTTPHASTLISAASPSPRGHSCPFQPSGMQQGLSGPYDLPPGACSPPPRGPGRSQAPLALQNPTPSQIRPNPAQGKGSPGSDPARHQRPRTPLPEPWRTATQPGKRRPGRSWKYPPAQGAPPPACPAARSPLRAPHLGRRRSRGSPCPAVPRRASSPPGAPQPLSAVTFPWPAARPLQRKAGSPGPGSQEAGTRQSRRGERGWVALKGLGGPARSRAAQGRGAGRPTQHGSPCVKPRGKRRGAGVSWSRLGRGPQEARQAAGLGAAAARRSDGALLLENGIAADFIRTSGIEAEAR